MENPFKPNDNVMTKVKGADVSATAVQIFNNEVQVKTGVGKLSRVGNLVILPHPGETVWWYEGGRFEMKFRGHHGGLTPAEMEIPLFLYPIF